MQGYLLFNRISYEGGLDHEKNIGHLGIAFCPLPFRKCDHGK